MSSFIDILEKEGYTVLDKPKEGGFAYVIKVRQNASNYVRAFKWLKQTVLDEKSKAYRNFVEEFETLRKLGDGNHPNIVRVYQQHLLDNNVIVEMDYVEGQDLREFLIANNRFLPQEEVIRMVEQISSALAYCHSKGVIHNDIHSGNIMRRENGEFVILDFGLAINGDEVVRSSSDTEYGAPEYKAPEKWENEKNLAEGSDIYSFGIVMYEYLAGRVPFPRDPTANKTDDNYRLKNAHTKTLPPEIFKLRGSYYKQTHHGKTYIKDYPDWLEKAVLKCLEKDPSKRFKDGKELYDYVITNMKNAKSLELMDLKEKCDELEKENTRLQNDYRNNEKKSRRRFYAALFGVVFALVMVAGASLGIIKSKNEKIRELEANEPLSSESIAAQPISHHYEDSLQIARLEGQVDSLVHLLPSSSSVEVDSLQQRIKDLNFDINKLNKDVHEKTEQLEKTNKTIKVLNDTISEKNKRIKELERKISKPSPTEQELKRQVKQLKDTIQEQAKQISSKDKIIEDKQKELNECRKNL